MSAPMKTPGVYIKELDAFGNSVVPVPTAIPVFIGYTQKTSFKGKSLLKKAQKISSLADFQSIYVDPDPTKRPNISFKVLPPQSTSFNSTDLYTGASSPSDKLGVPDNLYINTTENKIYTKDDYSWAEAAITIAGTGNKAPVAATPGDDGSYFIDTTAKKIYGPKAEGVWPSTGIALVTGTAAPTAATNATEGQYFYDTSGKKIYGPKTTGAWPSTGAPLVTGTGAPTSANTGKKDDFYFDTAATTIYGPIKTGTTFPTAGTSLDIKTADFKINEIEYTIPPTTQINRLHSAIKFFYANGGGDCYILSIGDYNSTPFDLKLFNAAIDLLKKESEPTMLVIPDAVELDVNDAFSLQSKMINHCGEDMPSRVAILDIPGGFNEPEDDPTASVNAFRSNVNPILPKSNSYAAVYYPWLHTTIYQDSDLSIKNIDSSSYQTIANILTDEFADNKKIKKEEVNNMISYLTNATFLPTGVTSLTPDERAVEVSKADAAMKKLSEQYAFILGKLKRKLNLMPPSAAMAGIYTSVDNNIGVWKAPANVGVQNVIAPAVKIDHEMQEDLNKPINGKSVCAIRAFKGMGNLVWGARTLDGNSNDWRYINVRRTLIYIEQSIKDAAKAYVFDPNDANTWVTVQSMISNFLTGLWKQGGLVGPKPADAFSVSVGLGTTMSNDDIQNGIMRISVKVALSHPAEFIEITFQQQQQKA